MPLRTQTAGSLLYVPRTNPLAMSLRLFLALVLTIAAVVAALSAPAKAQVNNPNAGEPEVVKNVTSAPPTPVPTALFLDAMQFTPFGSQESFDICAYINNALAAASGSMLTPGTSCSPRKEEAP